MSCHARRICLHVTKSIQHTGALPPWCSVRGCSGAAALRSEGEGTPQLSLFQKVRLQVHANKAEQEAGAGQIPPSQRVQGELLPSWVAPGSAVYANPICSQLDQLLLKCEDFESVLVLLVTHRGVFFVHNLVTAIQVLGALAEEVSDNIATNSVLRDPRYDLLIRDLMRFIPKLDFLAMANVACSLRQLDHKHYTLLSRMLSPLLKQVVPDVTTVLRCVQAYSWAGYQQQHQFYAHWAWVLAEAAPSLPAQQLVEACVLYGGAGQYHGQFFEATERALLGRHLIEHELRPHEASLIASAFTSHLRIVHDDILVSISSMLEREAPRMEVVDIVRCLSAFRRVALHLDSPMRAGLAACTVPLRHGWLLRRHAESIRSADVAKLLDCAAYFGINMDIIRVALDYLDDHVDELSDRASIQTVYAMCMFGGIATHSRLLLYLFRKVGAGTAWDAQRVLVFHLWVSQLLQFPWLDARLPRRCIDAGLRAWCLHRRGYGCPFPDEVRSVSAELAAMGVNHRPFVPVPGTPYEVDIAVGRRKDALLVVSETSRNTFQPVGSTLLQIRHLEQRGWHCVVIPRRIWLSFGNIEQASCSRQRYLRALLEAFEL